jgi:nucleotide-binding universal stress UspA family protein
VSPPISTIVVPLDLEPDHDRAVATARILAARSGLPLQLLTVSSPGLPDGPDQFELDRTATRHGLHNWTSTVIHSNEPAVAIADYIAHVEAPLLVISTEVRGVISELGSTDVAGQLLADLDAPILVLGPQMRASWLSDQAQVIGCIGPDGPTDAAVRSMGRWLTQFGGIDPLFVTVETADAASSRESGSLDPARVGPLVEQLLAETGIHADVETLVGPDPVEAILARTDLTDSILIVTSTRWADGSRLHSHSIARQLAHSSTNPVLVLRP